MIMLGRKKAGSIAASIKEKMEGKGYSHEDLKYNPEDSSDNDEEISAQALSHASHKLMEAFKDSEKSIVLVQGVVEEVQKKHTIGKIRIINFMLSAELEKTINESEVVVSRSGYTTILDLTIMEKKAFFIPTPGQYEQIYLAKRLKNLGIVPSCKQENFNLKQLDEIDSYSGLEDFKTTPDFNALFSLFEGK